MRRFDGLSNPGRGASGLRGVFLVSDIFSELIMLSQFSFKSFEKFQREIQMFAFFGTKAERAEHALEIWRNFRFLARARAAQPADVKGKVQKGHKAKKAGEAGRR